MCGFFAGIFTPDQAPSQHEVLNALIALRHRGPDGFDWRRIELKDGRVAIVGHTRLALVGVTNGQQPFVGDKHITVVNGEFYDWQNRKRELEIQGAQFKTLSDSELAHAAYGTYGAGSWISPLDGEWAACVIDIAAGKLHAACDPFGTKPLRYWKSADGSSFAVASEAKALFELGVQAELDDHSLRFALNFQYLPVGKTLFKGIGMIPPGHRLDFDGANHILKPHSNLALGLADFAQDHNPISAIEALRKSVRRRLPAERSFATHLSGGLDSALILALASEVAGPGIDAFVADFEFGSNETQQAQNTANFIGANLIPVRMTVRSLINAADQTPYYSEGLAMNGHAAAKILIAQEVANHGYRCVLTGEGADEAFWGYEHLRLDAGLALHSDAASNTDGVHRPSVDVTGLEALEGALKGQVPTFIKAKVAMTLPLQAAFGGRLSEVPFSSSDVTASLPPEWLDAVQAMRSPEAARALWNLHGLSGYILRGLDDAMGMSKGIESRLSFLDPKVQQLAAQTAPKAHFDQNGLEKSLLRQGAKGLIPDEVITRRKAPFMAPLLTATEQGRSWARDHILGGGLVSSGLFNAEHLEAMLIASATPANDANLMTLSSLSKLMATFRI